jgi:hypothetical protein
MMTAKEWREALLLTRQFAHAQNGENCELCEKIETALKELPQFDKKQK